MTNKHSNASLHREVYELNERAFADAAAKNILLVSELCAGKADGNFVYLQLNPAGTVYFDGTAVPDDERHRTFLQRHVISLDGHLAREETPSEHLHVRIYEAFANSKRYWLQEEHWHKEDERRLVLKAMLDEPPKSDN